MAKKIKKTLVILFTAMALTLAPATAFSIDTGLITEELNLPAELANDVEGVDSLQEEVEEIEDEIIDIDDADEITSAAGEETDSTLSGEETVDDLQEEAFDLAEKVTDEVADDPILSEVDQVVEDAEETVYQAEDDAFELVDKVEDEVIDETLDSVSSKVEDVIELVEDVEEEAIGDSEDDVMGATKNIVEEKEVDALVSEVEDVAESAVYELKAFINPVLTEIEIVEIIKEALDVPGVKEWSSDGWEFISMDFVGETKSDEVKWESALVYLHLPDGAGDPPEECFQGWMATVNVNLESGEVEDSGFPTSESHNCTSEVVLDDPDAAAKPSFVIAGADDVVSNDIYGSVAYIKTPSYEPEIFDHMDRYIAHLLNQKWKTFPAQEMTQVGWLITTVEGCASCGYGYIPANSSVLTFTDTSVFGNLEAHRIPVEWEHDDEMLAETICHDANYLISVRYDERIFNHNTKISCENADNDSKISNSVFFENWNAVESSSWAQDITGKVEAHSAHQLMHSSKNFTPWMSSTNEEQTCDSSREPTTIIDGNLASRNVASWSELDKVPPAC